MADPIADNDTLDAELIDAESDNAPEEASQNSQEIVAADDVLPGMLYVLPLSERPFFPNQVLPLLLNADPWLPTLEKAVKQEPHLVGLVLAKPDSPENATPATPTVHPGRNPIALVRSIST